MELICMKWTYCSSVQRQDTDHVWRRTLSDCPWKSPATQMLACTVICDLLDKSLPWGCSLESCHCLQISKLAKTLHTRVPMVCSIPRCRGFPSDSLSLGDSLVTGWLTGCNAGNLQERWVPFLGWEDPLEKEIATHSRILAWEIPWTEEPKSLQWYTSIT